MSKEKDYVRVCITLRPIDIEKINQIIDWRDGNKRLDRSGTIRRAINEEYNRLHVLHTRDLGTPMPELQENPYEPKPEAGGY
jgi:hypothetical protein